MRVIGSVLISHPYFCVIVLKYYTVDVFWWDADVEKETY